MRLMDLVLLQDVQSGYGSNWARIANTTGVRDIQIGDRFREQGQGPGGEEMEVAGVDISPVGGFSKLFFNRAANATQPEVHRLGCVLELTYRKAEAIDPLYRSLREQYSGGSVIDASNFTAPPAYTVTGVAVTEPPALVNAGVGLAAPEQLVPLKRGRGRPPGSKNKQHDEIKLPVGFQ